MSRKEKIDLLLSKWLSRKLLVFITSVIALYLGKLDSDGWVIISTAYIGGEVIIDAVTRLKGFQKENNQI